MQQVWLAMLVEVLEPGRERERGLCAMIQVGYGLGVKEEGVEIYLHWMVVEVAEVGLPWNPFFWARCLTWSG